MNTSRWMRGTLIVMGLYTIGLGVIFLFAPAAAEALFGAHLPDPVLTPLYGQVLIALALLTLLIASDPTRYALLIWGLVLHQAAHVSVFIYTVAGGLQTFQQAGPPIIANSLFLIALVVFRPRTSRRGAPEPQRQLA